MPAAVAAAAAGPQPAPPSADPATDPPALPPELLRQLAQLLQASTARGAALSLQRLDPQRIESGAGPALQSLPAAARKAQLWDRFQVEFEQLQRELDTARGRG